MIEIIGAPFDLCGHRVGSRMGPEALRMADLTEGLDRLGLSVKDHGDISRRLPGTNEGGLRNFPPLLGCLHDLKSSVAETLGAGGIPLVLGGEHTIVAGGIAAALQQFDGDLALLWIDAHADVNTPETSATGNLHGMPVAALQGLPTSVEGMVAQEWNAWTTLTGPARLRPERTTWLGLRDVDPGERPHVKQGLGITMTEIDRYGLASCVDQLDQFLCKTGTTNIWISFDVDALDPVLAPGTGTAVRGGLTYREAHLLAELLYERLLGPQAPYRLVGLDVVETNPLTDHENATARMAVEWVLSLFGKTIL